MVVVRLLGSCLHEYVHGRCDHMKVSSGTVVTLVGKDGDEVIRLEDLASWSGSINYEIVSRIHSSIPKSRTHEARSRSGKSRASGGWKWLTPISSMLGHARF